MAWHWSLKCPSTRRGQVIIICLKTHGQSWILHAQHVTELGQTGRASSYRTCRHPYRVNIQVNSLYCLPKELLTPERPLGRARHCRYPFPSSPSAPPRPPVLMSPRILYSYTMTHCIFFRAPASSEEESDIYI
jgi:hypothetical protein